MGPHSIPLVSHQGLSEDKGTSPLKKSWKRLARAKGRGSSLTLEGQKRGVYPSGLLQTEPEKKKQKVSDGNHISNLSLSAKAVVQPCRDQ